MWFCSEPGVLEVVLGGPRCGSALTLGSWKLFWGGPRCGSIYSEPGVLEKVLNQNLEGNGAL